MIIPDKMINATDYLLTDEGSRAFVIYCGADGQFIGKIIVDRKEITRTNCYKTFWAALSALLRICLDFVGDEIENI